MYFYTVYIYLQYIFHYSAWLSKATKSGTPRSVIKLFQEGKALFGSVYGPQHYCFGVPSPLS